MNSGEKKKLKCHSGHFIYIQRILSFLGTASLLRSESKILKHKEARVRGEGLAFWADVPPLLLPLLVTSWADGFLVTRQVRHWLPGALSIYLTRFQHPGASGS